MIVLQKIQGLIKMRNKIIIGFCVVVIAILFVGYGTWFSIEAINADYNFWYMP